MDLDTITQAWWFILFSVMVWLTIALPKRGLEQAIPTLKNKHWWADILLPSLAPLVGIFYALVLKDYPMLEGQDSISVRCGLGATAGYLSSHVVRALKARLKAKTGINVDSVPPSSANGVGSDPPTLQ